MAVRSKTTCHEEDAMRFILTLALAGALSPTALTAQTFKASDNPVSEAVRDLLARDSKNLTASAELLPADKYGYRPTPAQMSFGQLMVHIVQTNAALCSGISGTSSPWTPEELKKLADSDPKDSIVAAVRRSFDYCTEALAKMNDSRLAEEVTMFGRPTGMSRAAALITIAADWADHYSTAASYLRLNGILPPTAQPKK
jgi:uncharacterized damage-inducible protein DinB